ncbi:alpha/beta hydrolase family protein [Aeromicrobium terrae]|uniref:alpha/beta hydrolase family protein n=1 Tax=Aeromicrobium terrae TaxID=2498846 RepID=UPI001C9C0795|nr:alpha/beta hydrolase [Aeromicrobium terrae]
MQRLTYGDDPSQVAELYRPTVPSRGVVVVVHGGFWRARYDWSLGRPLVQSLVGEGWTALNLEYRRTGNGGGFPQTFDDVAAGIDLLADIDVDTSRVVTLGHSAGGHLAVWAAGRPSPRVPVTAAISQAGVLDLRGALEQRLGDGAVELFLGPYDAEAYANADPLSRVPLDVPVVCVHAPDDDTVPIVQSRTYVDAARSAGAKAGLVTVGGGHFGVVDPASDAWRRTLTVLETL